MKEVCAPDKHVLVCVNERSPGHPTPCCKNVGGEEMYASVKEYVRSHGLVGRVFVTRTRCLGFCSASGATVVVDGRWFTEVKDVKEILELL